MTTMIDWQPPDTFNPETPGLGLPPLDGVEHELLYDPLPSRCNLDDGGDGRYESLRHGTYSHHQRIVLVEDTCIVYWTQHSRDENGPGQRVLAKVGTFNANRADIVWGGDETLFEIAPAPVPVRRKHFEHDPHLIFETYAQGSLKLINGRLYMVGALSACHGWTDDVQYHGFPGKPLPPEHWFDAPNWEKGVRFDIWWDLGCHFVQEWRLEGGKLVAASPLYKRNAPVTRVEVAAGRFKDVIPVIEPYASALPFEQAPERMREDVLNGAPEGFERMPKYAPGTWRLTADGTSGLAHHTEFRRPDGSWVAIRDNLCNPGYYYAAEKARHDDDYPPAVRTHLFGHAMPVAGELPDGRPWIVCNNQSRHDMYLTLSEDGRIFDHTWLLLHNPRGNTDGGMHKGGGPQYFQAVTVGGNIWVVYSIAKEQVGVSRIPLSALPPPKSMEKCPDGTAKKSFCVSTNGNDAWSGRLPEPNSAQTDGPFRTLARARDAIRALKSTTGLPPGGIDVVVGGGEYRLTAPLAFTAEDSGTANAPVVYRAADGEGVRLSGSVRVTDWRLVEDAATLERLPVEARAHVVQADLRAHGINDFDLMDSAPAWAQSDPGLEVFFRGEPMTLARYPNAGFLRIAALSVEDGYHVRGTPGSRTGRFRIEGEAERLSRWAAEPGAMLHGYWFWDWADQRLAVQRIDAENGEITLDDHRPHSYGYRTGQWFYAFNLLCELDRPGEWYLDRQTGILHFWPPESMHPGDVAVSVLRDPITIQDVRHLTLQGFTIEAVRGTAIQVSGGEAVRIAGCTIRNVGGDAVRIAGGRGHTVCDCDICQTGDGGIHLDGGDRRTLTPGRHEAVNNHIHHIARWNPLYKVGIQLKGCGNRAAHNRLHDLPHTAIGFTGNDQTVEFNEIYQSVTGANDAGAIYTPGAHPEDWSMRGHRIRFNYLHHLFGFAGEGCSGIYLDDMFSGTEIHGNVLWRVSLGFLLGGGRDILSTNNVFIACPRAISLDARAIGWAAPYLGDVFAGLEKMPYREEPWASRYPELVNILDDEPALPKGNVIARNIVRGGGGIWVEDGAKPGLRMEDNIEHETPHFIDEEKADWRLREDSPALALGFEPLPLKQIGLQHSPLRPNLPPRRLFEAEAIVETPPVLRNGKPLRPGAIVLRVRNLGDAADSAIIRLRLRGGSLEDDGACACALAPCATAEKRVSLWAEAGRVHVQVVQDGVDGVLDVHTFVAADDAVTAWPAALQVSSLQPGAGALEALDQVPPADRLQWKTHATESASGFCNLHERLATVGEADAVVWIGCRVRCSEAMRVAVLLGYDGPVKLFVDGQAVFHDPDGTNPAHPDRAAPEVTLAAGQHELAVALASNQGRAWGIYLRLRRVDADPAIDTAPVLAQLIL